ncbi:MAG TPA: TMEM175 family protein [Vicinamibacterales bacterium]|jgi:uncharacterized membrane protein|nr:TMEM175 family protein [Vicinamibacterales bacterium]
MVSPRKHKISRLEEFSDAVFGFALTLLVITASVPRNYADLVQLLQGIPAFACCFALLVWIWHEHDAFFERYALQDATTTIFNSALLFAVLLYIYPLKFMFDSFMFQVFGLQTNPPVKAMTLHELARASTIYGFGFFVLMSLFTLLYLHAYRQRQELRLTALESFDARSLAGHHSVSAAVGLFAMLFALLGPRELAFLSPSSFALMGPGHWWYGKRTARRRDAFIARMGGNTVGVS